MPEATLEFVDGSVQLILAVDSVRLRRGKHSHFSAIIRVANAVSYWLGRRSGSIHSQTILFATLTA